MRCLNSSDVCEAHPHGERFDYKPEAEAMTEYCKAKLSMKTCPKTYDISSIFSDWKQRIKRSFLRTIESNPTVGIVRFHSVTKIRYVLSGFKRCLKKIGPMVKLLFKNWRKYHPTKVNSNRTHPMAINKKNHPLPS